MLYRRTREPSNARAFSENPGAAGFAHKAESRLRELQFTDFNIEKVRTLFTELEFTNLIKLIENGG